jgi:hypothetical protein
MPTMYVSSNQSEDPCLQELVVEKNVEALKAINQYNIHSAWFDLGYGGCCFGIFSAGNHVKALHALANDLMHYCLTVLFREEMTPTELDYLDKLVKQLVDLDHR